MLVFCSTAQVASITWLPYVVFCICLLLNCLLFRAVNHQMKKLIRYIAGRIGREATWALSILVWYSFILLILLAVGITTVVLTDNWMTFFTFLMFLIPAIYFIPSIIAYYNENRNFTAICALNLFAGWTMFGWIGSLVWAFIKND